MKNRQRHFPTKVSKISFLMEKKRIQPKHADRISDILDRFMRIRKRAPAPPGRIIKNHHLKPISMTTTDLAKVIGVSRKTLSKIVNEHGAIAPDKEKPLGSLGTPKGSHRV